MHTWTYRVAGILPAIRGWDVLDITLRERGTIMDRKRIHLAAIVWALMLLGSKCWALENQIINGEFDAGIEPWQRSDGDGFTIEVVQDAGLSGANALKIDVLDAAAQESIMISQGDLVLERGATYHIGFTAKADTDRQIGVILEQDVSWAYAWHEWIDLKHTPQAFIFEYKARTAEDFNLCFILKHSLFPLINSNENIDVYIDNIYIVEVKQPTLVPNTMDSNLAHDPYPPDGDIHNALWAPLTWTPGHHAVSHDVYIDNNFDNVKLNTDETFWGNYSISWIIIGFDYGGRWIDLMEPGLTIYWCINEVNDLHPDSPWKGDVWSFTIAPRQAFSPEPADGAKFINPNILLSWMPGLSAKSHTVYFGDVFDTVAGADKGLFREIARYKPDPLEFNKTYFWRIDEFNGYSTHRGDVWSFTTVASTPAIDPNIAHSPRPPDGVMHLDTWVNLQWMPGYYAVSHNVYFGTDFDAVNNGEQDTSLENTPLTFHVIDFPRNPPIDLIPGTTYYWRIDEINDLHPDSPWKGDVWSFWLAPYTACDPFPADGAELIDPNVILSWIAGFNAKLHTIYLGENFADVEAGAAGTHKGRLVNTKYCPDALESGKTYFWRVDEYDGYATHKGEIWSFSTKPIESELDHDP